MNKDYLPFPSLFIPRVNSLLHRLQHAPVPLGADAVPYLDQLMIFLEDPPPDVRDRWKRGAEMCAEWGFPSSGPAIWRLYRSYAMEWRRQLAEESDSSSQSPESLEDKIADLAERRTYEALANPNVSIESISRFICIELRRQSLELARARHEHAKRTDEEMAIDLFHAEIGRDRIAAEYLKKLQFALQHGYDPDRAGIKL